MPGVLRLHCNKRQISNRSETGVPSMPDQTAESKPAKPPVVVKKYANRRLYNTESSSYVTLEDLAQMVRAGRDFVVYDAKSGDDITRSVLTQIIVEEEAKGSHLLPESFLRQLIGFYGDSLQGVLPRYLEATMTGFSRQQEEMRRGMEQALKPFSLEEISQRNMQMMERAMSLFSPFQGRSELDALKSENAALKAEISALKAKG